MDVEAIIWICFSVVLVLTVLVGSILEGRASTRRWISSVEAENKSLGLRVRDLEECIADMHTDLYMAQTCDSAWLDLAREKAEKAIPSLRIREHRPKTDWPARGASTAN
jgi:hypothetical protein